MYNSYLNRDKFNYLFKIYLTFLGILGFYHLFLKHTGGADSTISEWLINYQGGFTKRGIIGEICFIIAKFFGLKLRFIIYLFQVLTLGTYFFCLYHFIKTIKINYLILLIIFSPIFLLYPFAELEVLARKEVFIFIGLIVFFSLNNINSNRKHDILFVIFILPLLVLIWEPVIFFIGFFYLSLLIKYKIKNFNKSVTMLTPFLPAIIIAFYIAFNPITAENHLMLENSLKENFNEICYMSCSFLLYKSSITDQFTANIHLYSVEIFIRYFLIILIGFGPLLIVSKNSKMVEDIYFFNFFKDLFYLTAILMSPLFLLLAIGSDWGRWVHISYTYSVLFFIHLIKNKIIILDFNFFNRFRSKYNKKYLFVIVFIIFAFGWNPKTSLTGDVGSFPGYRVPYYFFKTVFNNFD